MIYRFLIFLLVESFSSIELQAQSELSFQSNPGISITKNYSGGEKVRSVNGIVQDYRFAIAYPLRSQIELVSSIGIQFYNYHNYTNPYNSTNLNILAQPLQLNYAIASVTTRYNLRNWSFDLGYTGHYMITKNMFFVKVAAIIDNIAYVYPYDVSDRYQSSINVGINRVYKRFRFGLHYDRMLDNIYDTKGFNIPGPREYKTIESFQIGIEFYFKK